MSNQESFIDEVTEEVRRDQLYGYLRRYGWIAVLAVLAIVGGTAWTQYTKSRDQAAAEARGDALLAALDADAPEARAEALADIGASEGPVAGLLTASAQEQAGETAAAVDTLQAVADNAGVEPVYRELARLKALMIGDGLSAEERIAGFEALARPGQPFRLIAMEQKALVQASEGEDEAAIATLRAALRDAEATEGLRERASTLIVSLGGTLDDTSVVADESLDVTTE